MLTYARVWMVVWMALDITNEVSFPFEVLYAAMVAHLLTRSIPWLLKKYCKQVAA